MTMGTLKAMGEEKLAAHAPLGRLGDDEDLKGLCVLYGAPEEGTPTAGVGETTVEELPRKHPEG